MKGLNDAIHATTSFLNMFWFTVHTPRTREMLLARKQSGAKSKYVFPGPGTSGHLTTIQHAHEKAIRDAGLKPFEFYCWWHTFGTRCAESGMDKFTLARLMGHSSPRAADAITST